MSASAKEIMQYIGWVLITALIITTAKSCLVDRARLSCIGEANNLEQALLCKTVGLETL